MMKMFDHNPETKLEDRLFAGSQLWTSWAPMLPLQNPDPALALPPGTQLQPKILLRNTTPRSQTANVKLTFRGDSNKGITTLAPIQLKPFETHLVDVVALQQSKQIPPDAHWALVEISSLGNPDEIMAIASSFDSSGRYGSQTPFADQLSDHWVAGKFEVDSTHNSLIAVTNAGQKLTDAVLTFHYNHGEGQYEIRKTIAAGDQLWLNLGDIIHGSIADTKGRTFPPDVAWGTYEIREPGRNADPSLFEGKIIVDKTNGHLAYGCTTCCADGYPGIIADPENLPVLVIDHFQVIATNSCTGYDDDLTANFSGWDTSNHSVATMNSTQVTGVGVGTANASSSGSFNYNNGVSKYCQIKAANPHNTTNVQKPDHLKIVYDSIGPLTACPSTLGRQISYKVVDSSNTAVNALLSIREQFQNKSANSCNTPVTTTETCTTVALGSFTDVLTVGCNSVGGSCGFTYTHQQWVWCSTPATVIGTPGDLIIHNNSTSVGGDTIGRPSGTYIYP